MPGQGLGLQEFEAPKISRELAHEGRRVVSPAAFIPKCYPWYLFLLETFYTPEP